MAERVLQYGQQLIEEDDIDAVVRVLKSDFLTTGPSVDEFESELARQVGSEHALVCNSGTAALYLAMRAYLQPGDGVVVPAVTFTATASAALLAGLDVIFADVDADSGLMSVEHLARALDAPGGDRVKAVLPVHLGGRVCDPKGLGEYARSRGLVVIEDACHALGTQYGNADVGGCNDSLAACFSFHPVKMIAMGEGGALTSNSKELVDAARRLRNHGMTRQPEHYVNHDLAYSADGTVNSWYYEVLEPSHNFRVSDINCALGLSQLRKLQRFVAIRRNLIARYKERLLELDPIIRFLHEEKSVRPGWHLCAVCVDFARIGIDRQNFMASLSKMGVGTQVHYIPVHFHPYYRKRYSHLRLPNARAFYDRTLTLPLHANMTVSDVDRVVDCLRNLVSAKDGKTPDLSQLDKSAVARSWSRSLGSTT